jgi:ankyrin repeat protein
MPFSIDQLVIFAARAGNLSLLKERVSAGGNINYVDPYYGSALIQAIRGCHLEALDWLITNGADVNAQYHDGFGPLEIALRCSDPQVVYRLVCAGAKLTQKARSYYRKRLEDCLKAIAKEGRSLA